MVCTEWQCLQTVWAKLNSVEVCTSSLLFSRQSFWHFHEQILLGENTCSQFFCILVCNFFVPHNWFRCQSRWENLDCFQYRFRPIKYKYAKINIDTYFEGQNGQMKVSKQDIRLLLQYSLSVFIAISHCKVCSFRHPCMATGNKNSCQATCTCSPAVVYSLITECESFTWTKYTKKCIMLILFKRNHSEYKAADGSGLRQIARVTPFVPTT